MKKEVQIVTNRIYTSEGLRSFVATFAKQNGEGLSIVIPKDATYATAIGAALTGHLVLATVHTLDAVSTI